MPSDAAPAGGRLHPATLLFRVFGHARALLVPALLVLFFAQGDRWQLWLAVLFVPTVVFDVFQYLTLRWRYEAEELVIRQGLIFRQVRHLPYARVQNVDLKQGPLHRLARVAEVKIETAGGGAAEAVLRVIGIEQYEELRARIFAGRARAPRAAGAPPPVPARAEPLLRLGPGDLLLLALDPGRGLALVAIAWGVAWEFDLIERLHFGDRLEDWFASASGAALAVQSALALAAVAAVIYLLSAVASVLAFWDFRLDQEGEVFRVRRGLLTRQVASIPRRRIQVLTVKRSWVHRLLGRARVLVGTAGGDLAESRKGQDGGAHFAPIVRERDLGPLLARLRPGLDLDAQEWRPLGPRAARRFAVVPALTHVALGALLFAWFGRAGAAAGALLLLFALARARLRWRYSRWARPAWGFAWRSGGLSRSVSATFDDKLQAAALDESPFDRRHGHATLRLDTAGGARTGHALVVPYLPRAQASALRDGLVGAAAARRFRW